MSQGIFISYRRRDTSGHAAAISEALKAEFPKKKVFFDVELPEPGGEVIEKIERELASCQVVLAVIGQQWNAQSRLEDRNDFVRRELKLALDLKAQRKLTVLPVLVDGATLRRGQLPGDIAALEELEYLEIKEAEGYRKIIEDTRRLLPPYWIGSHADVLRWNLGWVELLERLIKLDKDEVPTIDAKPRSPLRRIQFEGRRLLEKLRLRSQDPGDEGTAAQWALIFERHPETWRMVLDRNDEIVAYWHVAPLMKEHYDQLIAGKFKAGMVTYDKLTMFEKKSDTYNLFFVITVVDDQHRNAALYRQLFLSFFEVLDKLATAEHPIYIAEVAADVWTNEGMKLAESFGMERVGHRIDDPKVLIYALPIARVLNDFIAKTRYPHLRQQYIEAGFPLDAAESGQATSARR